jgi:hypothetical protein
VAVGFRSKCFFCSSLSCCRLKEKYFRLIQPSQINAVSKSSADDLFRHWFCENDMSIEQLFKAKLN